MARQSAVAHNERSLRLMANELHVIAERISEEADRYKLAGLRGTISIDTQTSVDRGILELRKFHRSVEMQIKLLMDEQEHAKGRAELDQAVTSKGRDSRSAQSKSGTGRART